MFHSPHPGKCWLYFWCKILRTITSTANNTIMNNNNNYYYYKLGNYRICAVFFFPFIIRFFLSLYWKEGLSLRTFVREFCFCSSDCLLVVVFIVHHSILFGYSLARNGELLLLQLLPPTVIVVVVVIIIVVCRYPCSFLSFPWPDLAWYGLAWLGLCYGCIIAGLRFPPFCFEHCIRHHLPHTAGELLLLLLLP